MNIVNVIGGIGNQLFQYAFYFGLKKRTEGNAKLAILDFSDYALHQGYELEKAFSLNEDYCSQAEKEQIYQYKKNFINRWLRDFRCIDKLGFTEKKVERLTYIDIPKKYESKNLFYKGYWQSYKYFSDVESTLRDKLQFVPFTDEKNIRFIEQISGQETVSLHVRRGDYNSHANLGGICDLVYYQNAIKVALEKLTNPLFIIFSDDIDWCKKSLALENARYVDWNTGDSSFRDMHLMSVCNHNIIANSTFSWWGAWLNSNPNKMVIAPDMWMRNKSSTKDLIPSTWVSIPTQVHL